MRVSLVSLTLTHFKGLQQLTLEAAGQDVLILGANGSGKTTLADAWLWVLFGKDSANHKDFAIKTLGPDGVPIHNLSHEVEAVLEVDGQSITLKKAFSEKWSRKRGAATAEFTGHTTQCYVDGVPVSEKDYASRMAAIADEAIFRLLTSPTYFNESLHWQERRRTLLDVCGDLTDEEVIASDRELARLPAILQGRRLEDHRKVIEARRREINGELTKIPVRIDEASRALPSTDGTDASLDGQIAKLRAEIAAQQQAKQEIAGGGAIAQARIRMQEVSAALMQIANDAHYVAQDHVRHAQQRLSQIITKVRGVEADLAYRQDQAQRLATEMARLDQAITAKRAEWHQVSQETLTFTQESVCPACGQALPEEQLAGARDQAEADFMLHRSQRLEAIQKDGKSLKAERDALATRPELLAMGAPAEGALLELRAEAERALRAVETAEREAESTLERNPAYQAKLQEKAEIEAEIAALTTGSHDALAQADTIIGDLTNQLQALETAKLRLEQRRQGEQRIADLKGQEKALASEFERLEGELYLTEQFIRAKTSLLTDRINSRFPTVHFQLFETQVNQALNEVCITTINGVPYADLNHAGKIAAGLEIIRVLGQHYGFWAPVWIDGKESISRLPEMDCQLICLQVSEGDQALRTQLELKEVVQNV